MSPARAMRALTGGCVREGLTAEARAAGKRWRGAVARGDFSSAAHAWDCADHGVGYPYMTGAEYTAARAAFILACR